MILGNEIVVSENEEPLQRALADSLCRGRRSRIIEVGFGLGLAFKRMRELRPEEHWVIEGNKWLAVQCIDISDNSESDYPIVVMDTWEHALNILPTEYFHAMLFDPFPFDEEARFYQSWGEKFAFVASRAADMIARVLENKGLLGVINFDPGNCGKEWMREQFAGLFEFYEAAEYRSQRSDNVGLQQPSGAEPWILIKK